MKPLIIFSALILFVATSCDLFEDGIFNSSSSTKLGGSADIPINTVGNTFTTIGLKVGNNWVSNVNPTMEIIKSENGVNTIKINADLASNPALSKLNSLIPTELKDSQGKLNFELKVKITDEGWLDYTNADKEPVVLVKYDDKVGDKYSVTTSSGSKIVREITRKSTTDDYAYGFMDIKVIQVEQETSFPGLSKYVMYFNHKFGLVGLEVVAEDGSTVSSQISASMY